MPDPRGGTGVFPAAGRGRGCRATGAGRTTRRSGVSGDAPPILFSLSCERKENAPCTVEEKRETLSPAGVRPIHRSCAADLLRGRKASSSSARASRMAPKERKE